MPLPDCIPIPKAPQEYAYQVRFDLEAYTKYPEYAESAKRDARRKAALEIYKHFGSEPVTVTVTEKIIRASVFEIVFEIRAVLE